ncbi:MAG TPA: site-specific DNA-methyltransferase [Salinivirgaceae bacterium]|nr:site-specific DNA-methyltransferase [Salinivirgaceae bacterium]
MNELTNNTEPQIAYSECYAQVFLGDCLELYKNIEPKSIDLILTDLPYGTTACKWDTIIPFDKLWEMVNYLLKPNGAFITTASQPFTSYLITSNIKLFKYALVWSKKMTSGFANAKFQPMKSHEDVLVFCKSKTVYNPQMVKRTDAELKRLSHKSVNTTSSEHTKSMIGKSGNRYDNLYKYPNSIIDIVGVMNNGGEKLPHPTQKPVALFEYLLKTYSNENMTIFDPCMGSGTTGVACKNLNRNFIGIEKDENYFKIAEQRINARTLFS